jgi:1-acyl-sn-glycerol-3-phosphate acyltransferase
MSSENTQSQLQRLYFEMSSNAAGLCCRRLAKLATYGPTPNPPEGPWRALRTALLLLVGWGFCALVLTATLLFAIVTFRVGVRRYSHWIARLVGRTVLGLQGIELVVEHFERLADRQARIVLFNHTSQLDLFIVAALFPPGGSAVGKKEILWVPLIGWCFWAFRFYTIDRKNLERAKALLKGAADDLKRRRISVFIAPEGSRARDLQLQPFKKGAFHLAAETHVPIVPVIVRGAGECQPVGQLVADPGVVGVEFFPPIPTEDYSTDDVDAKSEELHEFFARRLEADARPPG